MADVYYTEDHEWISVENGVATIGITEHAQDQLGDMVFVELPDAGAAISKGDAAATVESVKAASEVYAPVDGEVIEANAALNDDPSLANSSPEKDGWFYRMTLRDPGQLDGLLSAEAYRKLIGD